MLKVNNNHVLETEKSNIKNIFYTLDVLYNDGDLTCSQREIIGETILKRYYNTELFNYAFDMFLNYCVPFQDVDLYQKSINIDIKNNVFLNF
ncbi:hypothetical protein [uncultured Pseudoramibacter sp.]|jgi:hypothetical protein|uniref:hypothetical protein n=1 Tax=uncultured Pseudoramibacter sp. TaxID=1623493 RepID=UPI0025F131E1|nr:hypothetical protein [uncultured Pseudoramibacter sp.]